MNIFYKISNHSTIFLTLFFELPPHSIDVLFESIYEEDKDTYDENKEKEENIEKIEKEEKVKKMKKIAVSVSPAFYFNPILQNNHASLKLFIQEDWEILRTNRRGINIIKHKIEDIECRIKIYEKIIEFLINIINYFKYSDISSFSFIYSVISSSPFHIMWHSFSNKSSRFINNKNISNHNNKIDDDIKNEDDIYEGLDFYNQTYMQEEKCEEETNKENTFIDPRMKVFKSMYDCLKHILDKFKILLKNNENEKEEEKEKENKLCDKINKNKNKKLYIQISNIINIIICTIDKIFFFKKFFFKQPIEAPPLVIGVNFFFPREFFSSSSLSSLSSSSSFSCFFSNCEEYISNKVGFDYIYEISRRKINDLGSNSITPSLQHIHDHVYDAFLSTFSLARWLELSKEWAECTCLESESYSLYEKETQKIKNEENKIDILPFWLSDLFPQKTSHKTGGRVPEMQELVVSSCSSGGVIRGVGSGNINQRNIRQVVNASNVSTERTGNNASTIVGTCNTNTGTSCVTGGIASIGGGGGGGIASVGGTGTNTGNIVRQRNDNNNQTRFFDPSFDPFRTRKTESTRAPSRHVDDFEADAALSTVNNKLTNNNNNNNLNTSSTVTTMKQINSNESSIINSSNDTNNKDNIKVADAEAEITIAAEKPKVTDKKSAEISKSKPHTIGKGGGGGTTCDNNSDINEQNKSVNTKYDLSNIKEINTTNTATHYEEKNLNNNALSNIAENDKVTSINNNTLMSSEGLTETNWNDMNTNKFNSNDTIVSNRNTIGKQSFNEHKGKEIDYFPMVYSSNYNTFSNIDNQSVSKLERDRVITTFPAQQGSEHMNENAVEMCCNSYLSSSMLSSTLSESSGSIPFNAMQCVDRNFSPYVSQSTLNATISSVETNNLQVCNSSSLSSSETLSLSSSTGFFANDFVSSALSHVNISSTSSISDDTNSSTITTTTVTTSEVTTDQKLQSSTIYRKNNMNDGVINMQQHGYHTVPPHPMNQYVSGGCQPYPPQFIVTNQFAPYPQQQILNFSHSHHPPPHHPLAPHSHHHHPPPYSFPIPPAPRLDMPVFSSSSQIQIRHPPTIPDIIQFSSPAFAPPPRPDISLSYLTTSHMSSQYINNNLNNENISSQSTIQDTSAIETIVAPSQSTIQNVAEEDNNIQRSITIDTGFTSTINEKIKQGEHIQQEEQVKKIQTDIIQEEEKNNDNRGEMSAALSGIPGWASFTEDGVTEGLDVLGIVQDPTQLKDPRIKNRFLRLLDRHTGIKNLFRQMGVDI